jgi:hypothetical protein
VPLTPEERITRARLAALIRWSREDGRTGTQAARDAVLRRDEDEVDPGRVLPPEERAARVQRLRKARMLKLAMRSARVRRDRAEASL